MVSCEAVGSLSPFSVRPQCGVRDRPRQVGSALRHPSGTKNQWGGGGGGGRREKRNFTGGVYIPGESYEGFANQPSKLQKHGIVSQLLFMEVFLSQI